MEPNKIRIVIVLISFILLLSFAFFSESSITGDVVFSPDFATHPLLSILAASMIIVVVITADSAFKRE